MSSLHLIIYAKNPIHGQVKTRLAKSRNGLFARNAYKRLLRHSAKQMAFSQSLALEVSPNTRHGFVRQLAQEHGLKVRPQPPGALGQRMAASIRRALKSHDAVLIMGSDCPSIDRSVLTAIEAHLRTTQSSYLQAAADGGYVLVACNHYCPKLFRQIRWSSRHVLADSRRQARGGTTNLQIGPAMVDIDHIQDWQQARRRQQIGPVWKR